MFALAIAGLATSAFADEGKVKVGMITTLSGGGAGLGLDVRDGFLLAAKLAGEAVEPPFVFRRYRKSRSVMARRVTGSIDDERRSS